MNHTTFLHEVVHFTLGTESLVSAHIHGQRRFIATDGFFTDYPMLDNGRVFWDNPEYWSDGFREECAKVILTSNLALIERTYRKNQQGA